MRILLSSKHGPIWRQQYGDVTSHPFAAD